MYILEFIKLIHCSSMKVNVAVGLSVFGFISLGSIKQSDVKIRVEVTNTWYVRLRKGDPQIRTFA